MSLFSYIRNIFLKRQERKQEELVSQIVSTRGHRQQAETVKPVNELLLRFFRNEQDEHIPHRLEDVARFTDLDMERYHDFIQWIYPTIKPSENHPNAPVIDEHFAEQLCADKCAMKNYCKTCRRYLNYLNFECDGNSNISMLSKNSDSFIYLPYHNVLRITRMLDSLNLTGHKQCSKAAYEMLFTVMKANPRQMYYDSRSASIDYWRQTQQRPVRKIIFLDFDDVLTTTKHCLLLNRQNLPEKDEYGVLFDPDCVAALKHIVDETNAEIVVTSSWREVDMPMQRLKEMWESRHLPGTLTDVTPSISQYRGEEISAWLTFCPDNCQYVIIDDLPQDQFLVNQYDHLVTTDGYAGLTMPLAEHAIQILNIPMQ